MGLTVHFLDHEMDHNARSRDFVRVVRVWVGLAGLEVVEGTFYRVDAVVFAGAEVSLVEVVGRGDGGSSGVGALTVQDEGL